MSGLVHGFLCSNITLVEAFYINDYVFTDLASRPYCIPQAIPQKDFDRMVREQHPHGKKPQKCSKHKNKD